MTMYIPTLIMLLISILLPDIWIDWRLRHRHKNKVTRILYWLPTVVFMALFVLMRTSMDDLHSYRTLAKIQWIFGAYIMLYIPKIVFVCCNVLNFVCNHFLKRKTQVLTHIGQGLGAVLMVLLALSMFYIRKNVHVRQITVYSAHLPQAFDGFRIAQFSDVHLGNWGTHRGTMARTVALINEQKPDLICFTGDMVNNFADELQGYPEIFSQLQAPAGKYAILGNHDYGDYTQWHTPADRANNLRLIKQGIRQCGFKLLLNEADSITRNGQCVSIIGVENWGQKHFKQYGNLPLALRDTVANSYKILLSHDSSHWDAEVVGSTNIDLTLSGHTHAAQMGIDLPWLHWSPSAWIYRRWDGLYSVGTQQIYVNRGIGYVGMPMRLGMSPEITLITLRCLP